MGRWKRRVGAWLAVALLCILPCPRVAASEGESAPEEREFEFSIGIYNEVAQEYALPNRTLDAFGALTVGRSIALLMQKGMLESYTQSGDRLLSISYRDAQGVLETLNESDQRKFYVKLNGEAMRPEDAFGRYLHDGDLVEWIFTSAAQYDQLPSQVSSPTAPQSPQAPAKSWNVRANDAQNAACNWLDDRAGASSGYLIAMGSAGRTANINVVNSLLAEVRKTESYGSPFELAGQILKLSYCGFDTSNPDLSELLGQLMNREGRENWSARELAAALTAYDCRGYNVPGGVVNSRDALVAFLLSCQREDGAFADRPGGDASLFDTAAAVTALASYSSRGVARHAVEWAIDYLAEVQSDDGLFRIQGQDSSEALSQVVIALMSAGVPLSDGRFVKENKNLLTRLLEYQQPDGGFAQTTGGKSDAGATESAVIALSALRQGGNPYRIASSLKNTVPISSQVPLQEIENDRTGYWIAGVALLSLCALAVIAVVILRRSRR